MDIIGLGTYAVDIIKKVNELPAKDGFCIIEDVQKLPGGSGANVIVQSARLGASCGYICNVGDDEIGSIVIDSFKKEGVDTSSIIVTPGQSSVYTDIVVDRQGEKFIMLSMGDAISSLSAKALDYDAISSAKVLYTDLIPFDGAYAALKHAKAKGLTTVFNMQVELGTMEGLGISRDNIIKALDYVDIFAPCRQGLFDLTGSQDLDFCKDEIFKIFEGQLLVTLGSQGSHMYFKSGELVKASAYPVKPVDTTGAGDSYLGAFMHSYILKSRPIKEAMDFASKCAAYTCMGIGARSSPTLEELEAFK